jgi:DNA-binding protein HU-beta
MWLEVKLMHKTPRINAFTRPFHCQETCMNKSELIDIVAAKAETSKVQAGEIISAAIAAITEAVAKGDSVQFIGFGTFSVQKREARTGRNPQTGKEMKIEAKNVVRFKAGAQLTAAANPVKATKGKKK